MRLSLLPLNYSPPLRFLPPYFHLIRSKNMATETPNKPELKSPITAHELVKKMQQIFQSKPTNGWDKCWGEGLTPWDLGSPTPVLAHLHHGGSLPKGRALIPGCGSGHDVVAIACAERYVVGLDVSDNAIKKAIEWSSGSPQAEHFTFLKMDFFTWHPNELFDLIFDYTFFCAIEPELRLLWARKMSDLLKSDGELITLMFPIDDHEGGPPFKVSVADYEEVLHPVGFEATHISDNELAIAPRMGLEKLGRWKRANRRSSFHLIFIEEASSMNAETPHQLHLNSPITADEKSRTLSKLPPDSWDKCWEEGSTPWDLGSPIPVLVHLHNSGSLPKGRALIPGCGSGHDVVAIACAERYVVGVDVSDNAIKRAFELSYGSPKAEHFTFLKTDFFTWHPHESFDLIFDHSFFCAIEPELRSLWARKMSDLLKPDGELITLMYPIDDREGGPPFKVSVAAYEEVLRPVGFEATHIWDNEMAIAYRLGREKLGRWKRVTAHLHCDD